MQQIISEVERVVAQILSEVDTKGEMPKQPVKSVILHTIERLQHVLFPGVFESGNIHGASYKSRLCVMLEEVANDLVAQIGLALRYDAQFKDVSQEDVDKTSLDLTCKFISRIPAVKEVLDTDIEAVYNGDPAAYCKAEIIISYPGIYATMVYRLAHELYLLSVPLIPRIMSEHAHSVTGIDVHPGAAIGKYFFMDHGTGIVIGETTVIGNHVKIYQGVTLGALSTSGGQNLKGVKRHPTINDNVTVYSGASILGGSTVIGEGVVVGGNAFVVKSVPENTRVSVKNPELQYKNNRNVSAYVELDQMAFWAYDI